MLRLELVGRLLPSPNPDQRGPVWSQAIISLRSRADLLSPQSLESEWTMKIRAGKLWEGLFDVMRPLLQLELQQPHDKGLHERHRRERRTSHRELLVQYKQVWHNHQQHKWRRRKARKLQMCRDE